MPFMAEEFTSGEKEFLLKIARITLEKHLIDGEKFEPQTTNQRLWEKRGVFVTLTKKGLLRGCIGYLEPVEYLLLAIRDNALLAARDPRFSPLERFELEDVNIEISVLSVPQKADFKKIRKGDGVIIKSGSYGATYLPQVWKEFPRREEFFGSLCRKAGLGADCYLDSQTEFYTYSALVFSEKKYRKT
jgi:AmmeMemoRadiSam system protein A